MTLGGNGSPGIGAVPSGESACYGPGGSESMSPSVAVCAKCGHVFSEADALDPCPDCGGTDRTLRREELVVEATDRGAMIEQHQVEERRPDGTWEVVQDTVGHEGGEPKG